MCECVFVCFRGWLRFILCKSGVLLVVFNIFCFCGGEVKMECCSILWITRHTILIGIQHKNKQKPKLIEEIDKLCIKQELIECVDRKYAEAPFVCNTARVGVTQVVFIYFFLPVAASSFPHADLHESRDDR